jgi:hypothetical protein
MGFCCLTLLITFTPALSAQETPVETEEINIIDQEVTLDAGLSLSTILETEITDKKTQVGDPIKFRMPVSLIIDDHIIIPQNSTFEGIIIDFSKRSLLNNTYNVTAKIDKLYTPFGDIYQISAHPDFDIKADKKNKGRRFKIGLTQTHNDQLFSESRTNNRSKKDKPFIIPKGEKIDIILDTPIKFEI